MKKILWAIVAAVVSVVATVSLASCEKDEDILDQKSIYCMQTIGTCEGFTAEEEAEFLSKVNNVMVSEPATVTEAKRSVDNYVTGLMAEFSKHSHKFEPGQKVTVTINLYHNSSATGRVIYSKTIVTTNVGSFIQQ